MVCHSQFGAAEIVPSPWGRWVTYAATQAGIERGQQILNGLSAETSQYLRQVSAWALSQSFGSLVKAIYEIYPDMKVNSIFKDESA